MPSVCQLFVSSYKPHRRRLLRDTFKFLQSCCLPGLNSLYSDLSDLWPTVCGMGRCSTAGAGCWLYCRYALKRALLLTHKRQVLCDLHAPPCLWQSCSICDEVLLSCSASQLAAIRSPVQVTHIVKDKRAPDRALQHDQRCLEESVAVSLREKAVATQVVVREDAAVGKDLSCIPRLRTPKCLLQSVTASAP